MKSLIVSICLVFALVAIAFGAEELTLSTPITKPAVTKWRVQQLILTAHPDPHVSLTLIDPATGDTNTCVWDATTTPTAQAVLSTLNTANLTSNSLQRRAIVAAQSRNCLGAGTIAGTPD